MIICVNWIRFSFSGGLCILLNCFRCILRTICYANWNRYTARAQLDLHIKHKILRVATHLFSNAETSIIILKFSENKNKRNHDSTIKPKLHQSTAFSHKTDHECKCKCNWIHRRKKCHQHQVRGWLCPRVKMPSNSTIELIWFFSLFND